METRTYTEKSNARRAARAAGVDPNLVTMTEDGFTFPMPAEDDEPTSGHAEPVPPSLRPFDAAIEQGISPKEFAAIAESAADNLDTTTPKDDEGIPAFCKIDPEERKAAWVRNPPTAKAAPIKETDTVATAKSKKGSKADQKSGAKTSGTDKTATMLAMLKKGATVDALCTATAWLPHTLRARISGVAKPKSKGGEGLKIERKRVDGVTSYRAV